MFDSAYTAAPVKLAYFKAFLYYRGGQLEWATTGEGNSRAFDIEQSTDGRTWQRLASMEARPGYGYVFMDSYIDRYGVPAVYYRLRLLAQNGRYTYSPVRRIRLKNATATLSR